MIEVGEWLLGNVQFAIGALTGALGMLIVFCFALANTRSEVEEDFSCPKCGGDDYAACPCSPEDQWEARRQ